MSEMRGKPTEALPWCWAEKAALQAIAEVFGENDTAARARSIYVALCELASDFESNQFTVAKLLIAHRAGTSVKTVERTLKDLARHEFIFIVSHAGLKAPNEYSLLSMRRQDATMRQHGKQGEKPDKVEETEKKAEKAAAPTERQKKACRPAFRGGAAAPRERGAEAQLPENCNF
jgi:hypothetical protein